MEDDIIKEKKVHKEIRLCRFDYTLFEKKEEGRVKEGIGMFPYLMNIIELCPGYHEDHLMIMNDSVIQPKDIGLKGGRRRPVQKFLKNRF